MPLTLIATILLAQSSPCHVEEAIAVSKKSAERTLAPAKKPLVVTQFVGPISWNGFVAAFPFYASEAELERLLGHDRKFYHMVIREKGTPRVERVPKGQRRGQMGSTMDSRIYSGVVHLSWIDAATCSVVVFEPAQ